MTYYEHLLCDTDFPSNPEAMKMNKMQSFPHKNKQPRRGVGNENEHLQSTFILQCLMIE